MSRRSLLFAALALPSGLPGIEINGFHLVESIKQRRSLEMTAHLAKLYKDENLSTLDKLTALLWNDGAEPYEIRGERGVLHNKTRDFQILEESEILSPDGFSFKTKNVAFDAAAQVLQSREKVVGHNRDRKRKPGQNSTSMIEIEGEGLSIQTQKNIYEIKNKVRARQTLGSGTLHIQSTSSVVSPGTRTATFLKSVQVLSPSINLKGERLVIYLNGDRPEMMRIDSPLSGPSTPPRLVKAQMKNMLLESVGLIVNFNPIDGSARNSHAIGNVVARTQDGVTIRSDELVSDQSGSRQKITMKGHVEITTDSRVATCQEAQYFPESGEFILEKIAAVKKGQELLEGEKIRFSLKDSQIHVERAKGKINKQSLGVGNS